MLYSSQQGLTLPELLITLSLISLLAAIATPDFRRLIESNRQQALQDRLLHSLQQARARAVIEGRSVEVCASEDGEQCGADWNKGWILKAVGREETLAAEQLSPATHRLHWQGFTQRIVFHANGQSPTGNGRFYLCQDGDLAWQLVLNRQGRVHISTKAENRKEAHRCG